uniref:Uncharacterized protein n=1 Tax=Triticum urartu TaxID=4572 RepID=A0A8R7PIY0_TRIUA
MWRAAAARKKRPGPWIYRRGLLLRLPGRAAASPSGDSDKPARDEERTTTVTCRRHNLDLAWDEDAPHKELSSLQFHGR